MSSDLPCFSAASQSFDASCSLFASTWISAFGRPTFGLAVKILLQIRLLNFPIELPFRCERLLSLLQMLSAIELQHSKPVSDMIADLISTYANLFEDGDTPSLCSVSFAGAVSGNVSRAKARLVARMTSSDYSKYAFLKVLESLYIACADRFASVRIPSLESRLDLLWRLHCGEFLRCYKVNQFFLLKSQPDSTFFRACYIFACRVALCVRFAFGSIARYSG